MVELNCGSLHINYISNMSIKAYQELELQVSEDFSSSPWYYDIVYVLQNLQDPLELSRNKARSIKLKATRFCIMNGYLY